MFKYLFLVSLILNVGFGVVWFTTNHHPDDVLDDCMSLSDKHQASLNTCEEYTRASLKLMEGLKDVTEQCVTSLEDVSKAINYAAMKN